MALEHTYLTVTSDISYDLTDDTTAIQEGGIILQATADGVYVTFDGTLPSSTNGIKITVEGVNLRTEYIEQLRAVPVSSDASLLITGTKNHYFSGGALLLQGGNTDGAGRHTVTVTNYSSDAGYYIHQSSEACYLTVGNKLNDFKRMESEDWGFGLALTYLVTSESTDLTIMYVSSDSDNILNAYYKPSDGYLYIASTVTGEAQLVSSDLSIPIGESYHIELDYSNDTLNIYGQGALIDSHTLAMPVFAGDPTVILASTTSVTSDNVYVDNIGYAIGRVWHKSADWSAAISDYPMGDF